MPVFFERQRHLRAVARAFQPHQHAHAVFVMPRLLADAQRFAVECPSSPAARAARNLPLAASARRRRRRVAPANRASVAVPNCRRRPRPRAQSPSRRRDRWPATRSESRPKNANSDCAPIVRKASAATRASKSILASRALSPHTLIAAPPRSPTGLRRRCAPREKSLPPNRPHTRARIPALSPRALSSN